MGGLSLGSSNAENWGIGVTITIRNLCMNNSVEALIWFNEEHLGLLKLHAHLGWGVPVWREGGGGVVMLHCIREVQCQQVFTTGF